MYVRASLFPEETRGILDAKAVVHIILSSAEYGEEVQITSCSSCIWHLLPVGTGETRLMRYRVISTLAIRNWPDHEPLLFRQVPTSISVA